MCCIDLPVEAITFFVRFSQFEYALKRIGGYAVQNQGYVKILWKEFLSGKDDISTPGNPSIDYYFDNPPAEFLLDDIHENPWRKRNLVERNNSSLLRLLRDVRNNLFHGMKPELVFGGPDGDLKRSIELLKHGNAILEEFMKLEPRIFDYIGH